MMSIRHVNSTSTLLPDHVKLVAELPQVISAIMMRNLNDDKENLGACVQPWIASALVHRITFPPTNLPR